MDSILTEIAALAEKEAPALLVLQRDFHAHPELGFNEHRTAAIVAAEMAQLGLSVRTGIAGTGVIASLQGGKPGKTVALRVDMDAFPITEGDGLPWRSQQEGVAHVCGHDAHVAIGVGVARILNALKDRIAGELRFIFQPAEEKPLVTNDDEDEGPYMEGVRAVSAATMVIEQGALANPPVAAIYGLHLWPWLTAGQIGVESGAAMAGVANFRASVFGKSAHGATPHEGVDSIVAVAQILNLIQVMVARQISPGEPLVVTVGTIRGGDRRNVIPDRVDITGTVRALSDKLLRETVPQRLEAAFAGISQAMDTTYKLDYYALIPPVMNDENLAQIARRAVAGILGETALVSLMEKAMTSEDFACYANRIPAVFLKIGCTPAGQELIPLHNRCFRFADETIAAGVKAAAASIYSRLSVDDNILRG